MRERKRKSEQFRVSYSGFGVRELLRLSPKKSVSSSSPYSMIHTTSYYHIVPPPRRTVTVATWGSIGRLFRRKLLPLFWSRRLPTKRGVSKSIKPLNLTVWKWSLPPFRQPGSSQLCPKLSPNLLKTSFSSIELQWLLKTHFKVLIWKAAVRNLNLKVWKLSNISNNSLDFKPNTVSATG